MRMSGEYVIPAGREAVWEALNDAKALEESLPGAKSVTRTADDEFEAEVQAKVGPVRANFKGKIKLSDIDPPNGYTISGEGSGGAAGFAKGSANVTLSETDGGTKLSYDVDAAVGGKLAQIGQRLIQGTAKKMADDFFANFAARFAEQPEAAVEAAPAEAAPAEAGERAPAAPSEEKILGMPRQQVIWIAAVVVILLILINLV